MPATDGHLADLLVEDGLQLVYALRGHVVHAAGDAPGADHDLNKRHLRPRSSRPSPAGPRCSRPSSTR